MLCLEGNGDTATGAACQQRTLTPPDTWSCPTLGLACVLMSKPISPELVLSPDLWISNTPRYFSFAWDKKYGENWICRGVIRYIAFFDDMWVVEKGVTLLLGFNRILIGRKCPKSSRSTVQLVRGWGNIMPRGFFYSWISSSLSRLFVSVSSFLNIAILEKYLYLYIVFFLNLNLCPCIL